MAFLPPSPDGPGTGTLVRTHVFAKLYPKTPSLFANLNVGSDETNLQSSCQENWRTNYRFPPSLGAAHPGKLESQQ